MSVSCSIDEECEDASEVSDVALKELPLVEISALRQTEPRSANKVMSIRSEDLDVRGFEIE